MGHFVEGEDLETRFSQTFVDVFGSSPLMSISKSRIFRYALRPHLPRPLVRSTHSYYLSGLVAQLGDHREYQATFMSPCVTIKYQTALSMGK